MKEVEGDRAKILEQEAMIKSLNDTNQELRQELDKLRLELVHAQELSQRESNRQRTLEPTATIAPPLSRTSSPPPSRTGEAPTGKCIPCTGSTTTSAERQAEAAASLQEVNTCRLANDNEVPQQD